jgi:hypothetical protein
VPTIRFWTREFPTAPEGDLKRCNGQPGSAVAGWLRSALAGAGIAAQAPIQEDYGWGFWLDDPATVWVAVSYTGGEPDDAADQPTWCVSVAHEVPFFAPRQWFRQREGREMARRAFEAVRAAVAGRPGAVIEDVDDD